MGKKICHMHPAGCYSWKNDHRYSTASVDRSDSVRETEAFGGGWEIFKVGGENNFKPKPASRSEGRSRAGAWLFPGPSLAARQRFAK